MAHATTAPTDADVARYLAAVSDPTKREDSIRLTEMMARLTGEQPVMWGPSIVGFGTYHYRYASGREGDYFLCGFAPRKSALVVYLMGSNPQQHALFAKLGKHKMGKACLYIKRLTDIDTTVLEDLIAKSVAALRAAYPAAD